MCYQIFTSQLCLQEEQTVELQAEQDEVVGFLQ